MTPAKQCASPLCDKPVKDHHQALYCGVPCRSYVGSLRYNNTRRKIIRTAKDIPCADCGNRYPHYVMDLDHVRGEKDFNIAKDGIQRPIDTLLAEIAKCEVVCSNCHRLRTWARKSHETASLRRKVRI